ncbi:MAG: geranyl transferase, partial [Gammaproteobacteria bacterium]|nr:geranyl transferase [Gammaproteobacteria bacterium]
GQALGTPAERLDGPAIAVECIHSYSLVHDDLPAMDDDDLRRGRPTCHMAFDEATAILAGDALQMLAVQVLADDESMQVTPARRLQMISLLAKASGIQGMAGGQAMDLEAAGKPASAEFLERMHRLKTGELIRASVLLAALTASDLSDGDFRSLDSYGEYLGLAFQIRDDILDREGDLERLGKRPGKDDALEKPNYPAAVGMAAAERRARELHQQAIDALETFSGRRENLVALSAYLLERDH